jgi:putative membrane protein
VKGFILGVVATAIALFILVQVLPDSLVDFDGGVVQLGLLALLVGVVNGVIKPVVKALTFPISLMTLGLFGFVVNAALLLGIALVADNIPDLSFTVGGFPKEGLTIDALVGAVVVSVLLGLTTAIIGKVVRD